jgi:hypothetical protein
VKNTRQWLELDTYRTRETAMEESQLEIKNDIKILAEVLGVFVENTVAKTSHQETVIEAVLDELRRIKSSTSVSSSSSSESSEFLGKVKETVDFLVELVKSKLTNTKDEINKCESLKDFELKLTNVLAGLENVFNPPAVAEEEIVSTNPFDVPILSKKQSKKVFEIESENVKKKIEALEVSNEQKDRRIQQLEIEIGIAQDENKVFKCKNEALMKDLQQNEELRKVKIANSQLIDEMEKMKKAIEQLEDVKKAYEKEKENVHLLKAKLDDANRELRSAEFTIKDNEVKYNQALWELKEIDE